MSQLLLQYNMNHCHWKLQVHVRFSKASVFCRMALADDKVGGNWDSEACAIMCSSSFGRPALPTDGFGTQSSRRSTTCIIMIVMNSGSQGLTLPKCTWPRGIPIRMTWQGLIRFVELAAFSIQAACCLVVFFPCIWSCDRADKNAATEKKQLQSDEAEHCLFDGPART